MFLLHSSVNWIQKWLPWVPHHDNHNRDHQQTIVDEHTPLERGIKRTAPLVVHNPPTHKRGFSLGFVSFFDSSEGILFGLFNLALYYLAAVIAFSFLWEKWTIIDSVYFATVTFTSVGYGDITPNTDGGRLFTIFFGLYGIFILGFFAGMVGEKIVEAHNNAIQAVEERARNRVKHMFGYHDTHDDRVEHRTEGHTPTERTPAIIIWELVKLELPLLASIMVLGMMYGVLVEGWTLAQSMYFAGITASTVGYGDFTPKEQWSRLICVLFLPLSVAIFCEVLGRIAGAYLEYKITLQEKAFLNQQITLSDLDRMDTNRDGEVEWGEFLVFMLTAMQKVDADDIAQLRQVFDKLDMNGTGKLDKLDIREAVRQK